MRGNRISADDTLPNFVLPPDPADQADQDEERQAAERVALRRALTDRLGDSEAAQHLGSDESRIVRPGGVPILRGKIS